MELSQAISQAINEFGRDIITEPRFVNILSDYGVFVPAPAIRSVVKELIAFGATRKILKSTLTSESIQPLVKRLSFEFTRIWPFQEDVVETVLYAIIDAIYRDSVLTLELSEDGKKLISFVEGYGEIRLPRGIEVIEQQAFWYKNEITKVIIPDTVVEIEYHAFVGCEKLEGIVFSDSVTVINYRCISGCNNLKRIYLPKQFDLEILDDSDVVVYYKVSENNPNYTTYDGCLYSKDRTRLIQVPKHYVELTIPEGVIEIDENAFSCGFVKKVNFPESLEVIHSSAFHSCDDLTDLHFPSNLKSIGDYAFCCCYNLNNVYLGSHITSIGEGVFEECYGLTQAIIDASCKELPERLFARCESLATVKISEGIETIGKNSFVDCSELMVCDIPSSIKKIDMFCFSGCNKLDNFHFPASVKRIHNPGLSGSYTVEADNCCYASYQGCLYSKDYTILYAVPRNKLTLTIKDGCIRIALYAVAHCSQLKKVRIPGSVKTIEDSAFRGCAILQDVTLEEGVEHVGTNAFCGCESISKIKLPDSVKTLQDCAFSGCGALKSIILSSELISIGRECFKNCTSLSKVSLPESLEEIGERAFTYSSIQTITIPQSVRSIGFDAFAFSKIANITLKAIYKEELFGHRDAHEIFHVDGTKEITFHVPGDSIESYKKYLPSNSKIIAIPGTTTPPPKELRIKDLFPIEGITLGKTTWKDASRLGFCVDTIPNSEERIVMTPNGLFGDMMGKGVFNYYIPKKLPKEWDEIGLKQEMSYNAIMKFFKEYNCNIKITQEPMVVRFEDRDTLTASFVIRPNDNSWRMKFIFKEGATVSNGKECQTKNTLCNVVLKV